MKLSIYYNDNAEKFNMAGIEMEKQRVAFGYTDNRFVNEARETTRDEVDQAQVHLARNFSTRHGAYGVGTKNRLAEKCVGGLYAAT